MSGTVTFSWHIDNLDRECHCGKPANAHVSGHGFLCLEHTQEQLDRVFPSPETRPTTDPA